VEVVAAAVSTPLAALIEPNVVGTKDHVPPLIELVSDELLPWHINSDPVIGPGSEFTVTCCVAEQPVLGIV